MGKMVHQILEVHDETVLCAGCGVVKKIIKDGRPKCSVGRREQRGKRVESRRAHGLTSPEARDFCRDKPCEICKAPYKGGRGGHAPDHNHLTGLLRGVLCCRCNTQLAPLEDSEFMAAALAYLARFSAVTISELTSS